MSKKIKSIRNFRDLGAIKTSDGKSVRENCFLRSAALNKLTLKDSITLRKSYGLSMIIDLRTKQEISEKKDKRIEGVTYRHMPLFNESTLGITHEDSIDDPDSLSRVPDLKDLYRSVVGKENRKYLAAVIELILSRKKEDGALLFHCSEGKDRTGIVSMIILSLLGVPIERVTEDYLLTNRSSKKKARKYYWSVRLFKRNKALAEQISELFKAKEEYLMSAYDEIVTNYGDVYGYVVNGLGIDKLKIDSFAKEFVV
ncbi:MAG: tyrosine-protein phosphatase [Ruminococcus sp.]|nr:tyrosine-protein phosphatase [Ruminococcus sp.]